MVTVALRGYILKANRRLARSHHTVHVMSIVAVAADFSAISSFDNTSDLKVMLVTGQKVIATKVRLSHESGPTLDSLRDRVRLGSLRHTYGGTRCTGREPTTSGRARILGAAGGSNTGHASLPTRFVQADCSFDHYHHHDHLDDDDDNDDDNDNVSDNDVYGHHHYRGAADHYHHHANEEETY